MPHFVPYAKILRRFVFFFLVTFSVSPAFAQTDTKRFDDYLFKVVVISPGEEIYMWWGHIGLIVEDTRLHTSKLYNWGMFTYPGDSFIRDFVDGRVQYMCVAGYIDVKEFIKEGWEITAYTLDLDRKAKEIILSYAENCVLPENRYYDYQVFGDNCATRIRDVIDMGTGGQFKAAFGSAGKRYTIRQYVRRFTWSRPITDWLFNFLMGQNVDQKVSPWEGMFIPREIARNISDFSYTDESGTEHKLVSAVETFNSAKEKAPIPDTAPVSWPFSLAAGLLFAVLLFLINTQRNKNPRLCRIILGLSQSLLGLFLGVLGCVLYFGLFYMKKDMIQQNINIWFINPLLLLIVPLGIVSAVKKHSSKFPGIVLNVFWSYVFIAGSVTLLIKILPFFYQQNQSVHGLILPVSFVLSGIPEKILGKTPTDAPSA